MFVARPAFVLANQSNLPLVVLAVFAVMIGWTLPGAIGVADWLEQARPAGLLHDKIADKSVTQVLKFQVVSTKSVTSNTPKH